MVPHLRKTSHIPPSQIRYVLGISQLGHPKKKPLLLHLATVVTEVTRKTKKNIHMALLVLARFYVSRCRSTT